MPQNNIDQMKTKYGGFDIKKNMNIWKCENRF